MNDERFLSEIVENPTDEALRLVYADWLEERGNPRGEFIRLQIERAKLPVGSREAVSFRHRERELLQQHGAAWAGRVAKITRNYRFSNGFVETINTSLKGFLEHSDELLAAAPIRNVGLRQCNESRIRQLAENEILRRLSAIRLSKCTIGHDAFEALVSSPQLGRLEIFSIAETEFDIPMSIALAKSRIAAGLRLLHIGVLNAITPSHVDVAKLVKASPKLEFLDLSDCEIDADDARVIASSNLSRLQYLPLPGRTIGAQGMDAVLTSPKRTTLRWLDFSFAEHAARLAGPMKRKLERLGLARSNLNNSEAEALFHSEHLSALKYLDLRYNHRLTSRCLPELLNSKLFANLECLRISLHRKLSKTAFESIVRAWKELERPAGNLCLPVLDLPPNVLKDIRKRYGKDSFVDQSEGMWIENSLQIPCQTLAPEEDVMDILNSWNSG